jgi:uncharacterized Tic20 family protein
MNASSSISPSSDERLMGALAHFFGTIAALIIWTLQKDKSRFVKFQALQALTFDFVVTTAMTVLLLCGFSIIFLAMFGSMFLAMNSASSPEDVGIIFVLPFMSPFLMTACVFPFTFALTVTRLIASISILSGRDFRYPVLGKWLENFLEK